MIDNLIFENLIKKFNRELSKRNIIGANEVVGRLEKLEKDHTNDSLGIMIYFTVRGMKSTLIEYGKNKER